MTKEERWMKNRVGRITASELGEITSASGKIIDGCVSYIRGKRWERRHGYTLPVSARTMDIGNENESMIFMWAQKHIPGAWVYSKDEDLPEIPFWVPEDMPFFGASPDAYSEDETAVLEFKTLVGNEATFFFMDEYTPYVDKKARVLKEHGDQIMGLFLSKPDIMSITLIKYAYQRDDVPEDRDSPLADWRGIIFRFERSDYEVSIEEMRQRIVLINAMIDTPVDPMQFKVGSWSLKGGQLTQSIPEPKKK